MKNKKKYYFKAFLRLPVNIDGIFLINTINSDFKECRQRSINIKNYEGIFLWVKRLEIYRGIKES